MSTFIKYYDFYTVIQSYEATSCIKQHKCIFDSFKTKYKSAVWVKLSNSKYNDTKICLHITPLKPVQSGEFTDKFCFCVFNCFRFIGSNKNDQK